MDDPLGDARLAVEALPEGLIAGDVLLDELESDDAVRTGRLEDAAHASDAERRLDGVRPKLLAGLKLEVGHLRTPCTRHGPQLSGGLTFAVKIDPI